MNQRKYHIGKSNFVLKFGDITSSKASVLVSSDDYMLTMGGGVSAAIRREGGEMVMIDASKKVPAQLGDIVVTSAGALPAKHIFHAITIGPGQTEKDICEIISNTTRRCLLLLESLGLNSIAFPAIGAGSAGFGYEDVAVVMADVITEYLSTNSNVFNVTLYLYDPFRRNQIDFVHFFEEFAIRVNALKGREVENNNDVKEILDDKESNIEDEGVVERQNLVRTLSELAKDRDRIERELAEFSEGLDDKSILELKVRLDEIHKKRLKILSKLRPHKKEKGVQVFISYAHEDEQFREDLGKHLSVLEREGLVTTWHDRMIQPGKEWKGEINSNLANAGVILLLISSDFIDSDYCYDIELKRALKRHENRDAIVIPVILRPVVWQSAPFSELQALPKNGRPVIEYKSQDAAFVEITEGVRTAIESFMKTST